MLGGMVAHEQSLFRVPRKLAHRQGFRLPMDFGYPQAN